MIGTTGWQAHEAEVRQLVASRPIGVVAAPNFALGVNLFLALVAARGGADGGAAASSAPGFTSCITRAKRGRAVGHGAGAAGGDGAGRLPLRRSTSPRRAPGSIPGTHTVGFDAAAETITLTHTARDRSVFARGALEAARWVHGRRGWFTMKDVLGL